MSRDDSKRIAELWREELGDPPADLGAEVRAVWFEVRRATPTDLISVDQGLVEMTASGIATVRQLTAAGVVREEWLPIFRLAFQSLGQMSVPRADRRRLILGAPKAAHRH